MSAHRFAHRVREARTDVALVALLAALALSLSLYAVTWSLPSDERSRFYPRDAERWYTEPKESGRLYATAPYEPYHPDESFILDAMANMDPARLDFNPRFFNYPTLHIYLTAAAIQGAHRLGLVEVVNSKQFYVDHPDEMARIYLIGRAVAAAFGAAAVGLLYGLATVLFGDRRLAFLAALTLAITPMWVRDSHFMAVNVPAAAWGVAVAFVAALAWRRASWRLLLLAGLLAGFAASTKYPAAATVAVPLLVSTWLGARAWRRHAAIGSMAIGGFLLGTPYLLAAPRQALADIRFEGSTKSGLPDPAVVLTTVAGSMGTWLAALALIGLAICALRRDRTAVFVSAWLVASLLPVLTSAVPFGRYALQAAPPLALLAAMPVAAAAAAARPHVSGSWRLFAPGAVTAALLPTVAFTFEVLGALDGRDVRTSAAAWIDDSIEPGATIGVMEPLYFHSPPVNAERFALVDLQTHPEQRPSYLVISRVAGYEPPAPPPGYAEAKRFVETDSGFGRWPVGGAMLDWGYTFLEIRILSRVTDDSASPAVLQR